MWYKDTHIVGQYRARYRSIRPKDIPGVHLTTRQTVIKRNDLFFKGPRPDGCNGCLPAGSRYISVKITFRISWIDQRMHGIRDKFPCETLINGEPTVYKL